jgi:hypothetical protein
MAVPFNAKSITVILDLMEPFGAGRNPDRLRGDAELKWLKHPSR